MQSIDFVWILIQTIEGIRIQTDETKILLLILLHERMAVWHERDHAFSNSYILDYIGAK